MTHQETSEKIRIDAPQSEKGVNTAILRRHIMAVVKLTIFLLSAMVMVMMHFILYGLFRSKIMVFTFHRFHCWLFGLRVKWYMGNNDSVKGGGLLSKADVKSFQSKYMVFMGNHVSYLDILALGAQLDASFVAKADVASWPLFGFLAKLQNTVFISRNPRDFTKVNEALQNRLRGGDRLIIFPEGTSSDGSRVMPLKSSLFSLFVEERKDAIVPQLASFTISIKKIEGLDINEYPALRDYYAWYGDMTLVPHLWALAHLHRIDMAITLKPFTPQSDVPLSRKEYANKLHQQIAQYL